MGGKIAGDLRPNETGQLLMSPRSVTTLGGVRLGREYLRVSKDRSGRARSIEEQHDENARYTPAHGITISGPAYSDLSMSASRYATKPRGDFVRLLADLAQGRFGADVLVVWDSWRGSRDIIQGATLINELEAADVRLFVTTHARLYDCSNARDRKSLLEDALDGAYDSDKKSEAITRAAAATASRGEPYGRVPYGYRRIYDEHTRRLVKQEPDPGEAPVIRELYDRLKAGHSLRSIADDFAARGIRTRLGRVYQPSHLRDLALMPAYAGLRVHHPGKRGAEHRREYRGSVEGAAEAAWEPLVSRATWYAVRNMLKAPERVTTRPGRAVHLLSLIAVCDKCGAGMTATYRRGYREYACRAKGCVFIRADNLDGLAVTTMLVYLAQPANIRGLRAGDGKTAELEAVRGERAQARAELGDWRAAARAGRVSLDSFADIEPGLLSRIVELERREQELSVPPALSMIPPGADVARRWEAAPTSARRQVARLLCSPEILGQLRVCPSPVRGQHCEAVDRVIWQRRQMQLAGR
jgi:site-specific DNA recombinase